VAEVLVNAADVPALLKQLAPLWAPYKNLNGTSLRTQLDKKYGVKVASTGNRHPIDPVAIRDSRQAGDRRSGRVKLGPIEHLNVPIRGFDEVFRPVGLTQLTDLTFRRSRVGSVPS
jgi:hypothetical protein